MQRQFKLVYTIKYIGWYYRYTVCIMAYVVVNIETNKNTPPNSSIVGVTRPSLK